MSNGRANAPTTPGFVVSMAGLAEIPLGLLMALFLDDFVEMAPIFADVTVGQFIGLVMMAGGAFLFLYGRHMGWTRRGNSGWIGKSDKNSNNSPIKRM